MRKLLPQFRKILENAEKWDEVISSAERSDNWQNAMTGIGTSRDKTTYNDFQSDCALPFGILEALYHNDDLAARVCDEIPEQALRSGYDLTFDGDTETPALLMKQCTKLDVVNVLTEAWTWGRLYGGGAVFIGADDGIDVSLPLQEDRIQSVKHLTVFDRWYMIPSTWYVDPKSEKFGQPETYRILRQSNGPQVLLDSFLVVHETRMLIFGGARTGSRRKREQQGWDDSILQKMFAPLQMFAMNWASTAQLMSDAGQGVYKMKGLAEALTSGSRQELLNRMAIVDQERSSARMIMVDAEDEAFERTPTPFAGIPEVLVQSAQRLAAAAGMPVTILMGSSPSGMNATGDSDVRGWYDKIAKIRELELRPRLERLLEILLLAKDSPTGGVIPDGMKLEFPPLWQPTDLEKAQARAATATSDCAYIAAQVFLPEEIALSRATPDGYSPEYSGVNIDARKDLLAHEAMAEKLTVEGAPVDPNPPVEEPPVDNAKE